MCYSAEASFTAGAVLLPAGLYCVRSAARKDRTYLALASVPLLFGVQQCCEGVVWLGLGAGNRPLARDAALGFLFFALFFWPFWVPFSVSLVEPRERVRQLLSVLALLALAVGWLLYGPVVVAPEARLDLGVVRHSIQYNPHPVAAFGQFPGAFWQLLYLAGICCPLLLSLNRRFRVFALSLAASGVVSHLVYRHAFESVWCFFAAVLSVQLCYAFRDLPAREGAPAAGGAARRI